MKLKWNSLSVVWLYPLVFAMVIFFGFNICKYIKVPNSCINLLNKLHAQTEYKLDTFSTRNDSDTKLYYMKFKNDVCVDFFVCKDASVAKNIYRQSKTNSVGFELNVMYNSMKYFNSNGKYTYLFKYHNEKEDFVVKIYATDKKQLKEFLNYYLSLI